MKKRKRSCIIQIAETDLVHRYLDLQQSASEIARTFDCSSPTVVARLKEYGIPNRGIKEASNTTPRLVRMQERAKGNTYCRGRYKIIISEDELRHRYLNLQQSTPDIAREFDCSKPTILERLKKYQIPIRRGKEAHNTHTYLKKFTLELSESELREKYLDKQLGMPEISIRYGCSTNCIRNNLLRYGIPIRSKEEAQSSPACIRGRIKNAIQQRTAEAREQKRQLNIERYKDPKERVKTGLASKQYHINNPEFSKRQTERLLTYLDNPETREKWIKANRKSWQDPIRRAKTSERFKQMWRNPIYRAKAVETSRIFWNSDSPEVNKARRAMMAGMNIRPNKPELVVFNLLNSDYPTEWKYTGDGKIIIGGLNPDFFNVNGKKLIIEVFGDYWHTQKLKPYRINEGRVDVYAKYGYKTLIIWERETKSIGLLKDKIKRFVETAKA